MTNEQKSPWQVKFTGKARKQKEKLSTAMAGALYALRKELEAEGPERINWPHYGKITGRPGMYHCHLNKGQPRYVAVWKVMDKSEKLMEIRYVGTHENADYRRLD